MLDAIRPLLPGGFDIDDAMLAPLSDKARAARAPLFVRGTPGSTGEARSPSSGSISTNPLPVQPGAMGSTPSTLASPGRAPTDKRLALASTVPLHDTPEPLPPGSQWAPALPEAGGETMRGVAAPPRATSFPVAAIVLTGLALGGVGVYALVRPVSRSPPPSSEATAHLPIAPTASATAEPSAKAEPVMAVSASATASAAAPPVSSVFRPERKGGVLKRSDKGKPAASAEVKEPARLDHTSFGDRK
jgi:hypothetical protein